MKFKPFLLSLTSSIIFTSTFLYSTGYAGFNKIIKKDIKNQIKVTTENGLIDPNLILELEPENNIKIVTSDGTTFDCLVKVVKFENNTICKVFGDILNKERSAFGFALSKSGSFAGAILFKNESYLYTVEHSQKIGGFVFVKKNVESDEPPQRSVVGK